jgi:peptide/nickel transport system permease protein
MNRRFRLGLWLAVFYLALLVCLTVAAHWVVPHDPLFQDLARPFAPPDWQHWLGTDHLGRDVLSRLIIGGRPALAGVLLAVVVAALVGVPWGLLAGYLGGSVDAVLMRIADALLVFPGLILALVLTAIFGPSLETSMIAIGLVYSPILARVTRSSVLVVSQRDYVQITRLYGLSDRHRMCHHVLPNAAPPIVVQLTLLMGLAMLAQIGLGFLGVGIQPPHPSWGAALAESFPFIIVSPQASIAPGLIVVLTILSLYRIGDALRDRFAHE